MPAPITATGPNGEKIVLKDGAWVPLDQPVIPAAARPSALPGLPTPEAAEQDQLIRQGMKSMAGELVANVLGLPHAAGELLALGAAGIRTGAGAAKAAVTGEPIEIARRFARARQTEDSSGLATLLQSLPEPSGADVLSAVGAEPVESELAAGAGRTAADVATLLALKPGERVARLLKLPRTAPKNVDAETMGRLNAAAKTLTRGLGRAAEAGFDGAVIGALGDGDPLKTAAWSAGIQAGGSAALAAKSTFLRNPIKSFGALWLGHQMWKAVAPGPQQAFESSDAATKELVAAYGLGIAASLAGAGRSPGKIIGTIEHASRAGIASVVTQLQEASRRGDTTPARVLELMSDNPDYFGRNVRLRLERASRSKKPNAVLDEIDSLMRSERFRRQLENAPKFRTGGAF